MYNLYNLEASNTSEILSYFKSFLLAEKISSGSVRSYLSDVRFFLNWFVTFLKQNLGYSQITQIRENLILKQVNQKVLEAFKKYLTDNNVPLKTINRRFSSLRKFGSFCQSQQWCTNNPFDTLKNVSFDQPFPETEYHLGEFRTHLWKRSATKSTLKNYLGDAKQFIEWGKDPRKSVNNPCKS